VVDDTESLLSRARINDDAEGLAQLMTILAEHGDSAESPTPVAIETSRGLLVSCLRGTVRPVYAINPMAAARYRDRHAVSRKKSDHLDAMVLANIPRTDAAAHRRLPADSELAQAIAVLGRAQQDAVWDRTQAGNCGVRCEGGASPVCGVCAEQEKARGHFGRGVGRHVWSGVSARARDRRGGPFV
jgi:transposase